MFLVLIYNYKVFYYERDVIYHESSSMVWSKDVRVEDREPKELKDNEVKVKVSWAGICGTDLHEYLEGQYLFPLTNLIHS